VDTITLGRGVVSCLDMDLATLTKPWIRLGLDPCIRVETPWDPYIRLVIMIGMCFL
jgi:hypothetical protein